MRPFLPFLLSLLLPFLLAGEGDPAGTVGLALRGDLPLLAPFSLFFPFSRVQTRHQGLELLRRALRAPEPEVVLDLSRGFAPTLAAAEELADALRRRPQGKRVLCLLESVDDAALIVAAACDDVVVAEGGMLLVDGLAGTLEHYADLLAKAGVRFHAVASGPYKTAPEPLTRSSPSPEALEELRALVADLDAPLRELSLRPGLDEAGLRAVRAAAPQVGAAAAELGLGAVVEPGAWLAARKEPFRWLDDDAGLGDLGTLSGLIRAWGRLLQGDRDRHPRAVAVVQLEGMIVDGEDDSASSTIAGHAVARLLDDLADDEAIAAVVLRINSRGGSASASDRIHHAVRRLDAVKPVVALLDDVAASGGYYIACAARRILVHRTTITGSIGVFVLVPDLSATRDLLGITRVTVATDPRSTLFSTEAMTPERRQALEELVQATDRRFQALVAERRGLPPSVVAALAGGRLHIGVQAVERGLADGLGTLPDAVALARTEAGIAEALPLEVFPKDPGLGALLGLSGGAFGAVRPLLPAAATQGLRLGLSPVPVVMAWSPVPNLR